ncbi:MAG: hypothetical protein N3A57_03520 [Negativicutes bacterium]|nr:hypothetical protein [Negativicutes bacterium]
MSCFLLRSEIAGVLFFVAVNNLSRFASFDTLGVLIMAAAVWGMANSALVWLEGKLRLSVRQAGLAVTVAAGNGLAVAFSVCFPGFVVNDWQGFLLTVSLAAVASTLLNRRFLERRRPRG